MTKCMLEAKQKGTANIMVKELKKKKNDPESRKHLPPAPGLWYDRNNVKADKQSLWMFML